ncbi:TPA: hypothetical protein ACGO2R_002078 [Streptococcus suis]|uniref:hypothetical protein n=1 Tax=Streptococcus suis TaxID=1307 RepID=UPI0014792790
MYLTETEFEAFGFETVDNFEKLLSRAQLTIDQFIGNFYSRVEFESDFAPRKKAVQQAMAFQIVYLDSSGILTAEDKATIGSMTVGRTSVSFQNGSNSNHSGKRYNLCLDALNCLQGAGFGFTGVSYDR